MQVLVRRFLKKESTSGIILMIVTVLALLHSNSFLSEYYNAFLKTQITFSVENLFEISKPLILWVNDGLMAIFFLLIGLEIKRELILGHLSSFSKIALPGIAAIGGMLVPALIFIFFNYDNEVAMKGWAIPTATDIAFALGILSLLGNRIPVSLKIFLMALAIFDDLGAIIIIALFYTHDLSLASLFLALLFSTILFAMNKFRITSLVAYAIVGTILWACLLKSGVHATLAGIIIAFAIPLNAINEKRRRFSPVKSLQHHIHFWVAFYILPIFAFMNAGIDLRGMSLENAFNDVSLGIILGLFIGKQVGVFTFVFLAVKFKFATLPRCTTWIQMYGVSVLTGIGFTMSLFINSLAFMDGDMFYYTDKLGILLGSVMSGILGYLILLGTKQKKYCKIDDDIS